jgi:hypothetical protein
MDFIFLSSVNTVLSFIVMVIKLCPMDLVVQNAIQLWRSIQNWQAEFTDVGKKGSVFD